MMLSNYFSLRPGLITFGLLNIPNTLSKFPTAAQEGHGRSKPTTSDPELSLSSAGNVLVRPVGVRYVWPLILPTFDSSG